MSSNSQASTFLDQEDIAEIPDPQHDPERGQVPFVSALKLTYDQEKRMVAHAMRRIEEMETELGRNLVSGNNDWFKSSTNINLDRYTFMGRRSIHELNYQNKVWWRKYCIGAIYKESNLTLPFARTIARQMLAQAVDYFFGTDPWFSADPIGGDEEDLAEAIDEFSQFKVEKNGLKSTGAQAIEGAIVRGESVVKTVWETDEQTYEQFANVLTDLDGKDILDVNGDWITDKDKFIDEMQSEVDTGPGPNMGKPIPGSQQPTGRRVLRKDMTTEEPPEGPQYTAKTIRRRKINFKGAKSNVVYWQDILIPLMAPHVQRGGADIVVHLYDMMVMKLIDLYVRRSLLLESPSAAYEETQHALKMLRAAQAGGTGTTNTANDQPRQPIGEVQGVVTNMQGHEPKMQIAEVYMTFDANEDGQQEEIALIIDRKNKIPVFYDYLPNVTPDGERPVDVIRIQPIEGRWYGIGAMEIFDKSQRAIDLFYNRWNLSQSQAGRVTAWKPSNTLEGDRNPNLPLNWGGTITLKPDKTIEETLAFVTLPEVKGEDLQKIMQLQIQVMTSESGTSSANDAAIAGLDTSKLATGVKNIDQHNQIKMGLFIGNLLPSLGDLTKRNLKVEFANATVDDVLRLFHGNEPKAQLLLDEDLSDLDLDISITLSKYHNQQVLASSMGAQNAAAQFFQYPPQVQHLVAPLYIESLRAYGIPDANAIIVPLDEPLPQSAVGPTPPAPQAQPGQPAPGEPAPDPNHPSGPISQAQQIVPGKLLLNKPPSGS